MSRRVLHAEFGWRKVQHEIKGHGTRDVVSSNFVPKTQRRRVNAPVLWTLIDVAPKHDRERVVEAF